MTEEKDDAIKLRQQAINEIEELYGFGPYPTGQRLARDVIANLATPSRCRQRAAAATAEHGKAGRP